MFIQTETTPNPATLKFLPGRTVMDSGTANFADASEADNSLLAQSLFATEGVLGVFLGSDFITVSKAPNKDWDVMKPLILGAIMEHFQSGHPVIETNEKTSADAGDESGFAELEAQLVGKVGAVPAIGCVPARQDGVYAGSG